MTSVAGDLEAFLAGDLQCAGAADEAAWHRVWTDAGLGALPPVRMAVRAGLMASSLPQVFVAGYQAALHTVFPSLPQTGWAAFVAAEDRSDPVNHPGTTLKGSGGDLRMDGFKSWVGQSRHVEHLMVSARQGPDEMIVSVGRDAPGIIITHRENPSFLAGLSQGFARFEETPVQPVAGVQMRDFGRTEPKFVMLAGAAFLTAAAKSDDLRVRAASLTAALASYAASGDWAPKLLAAFDRELQALATAHDGTGTPGWEADRRLFAMYSPRIQKRA